MDEKTLHFRFEVKRETRHDSLGVPMWDVSIVLPKKYYSKENLNQLFRFYSRKHANKDERLLIYVYTDPKNWEAKQESLGLDYLDFLTEPPVDDSRKSGHRSANHDAVFFRQGDGAAAGGGDNEWYIYSPDLENPNETATVVLRGKDPFATKNIIETWDVTDKPIRVRVIAYELNAVEPKGVYHTIQSARKEETGWHDVMTFRREELTPLLHEQVRFVSEEIAYLFMGLMYAVTTDGGSTWSVWDGERDVRDWQSFKYESIREIHVAADGTGAMKLSAVKLENRETLILHTVDYGRQWSSK